MINYEDVTSEVVLSSGKVLVCHRVPPGDMELFEDAHVKPRPPKREAVAVGGVVQIVDDEENEDYQRRLTEFLTKKQEDMRRMIFDHVEFKELPTDEEKLKMQRWGVVPDFENKLEEKEIWIRHYMSDYFVDWLIIRDEVMRLSTVTEGEVQRALERFQRRLGGGVTSAGDGDTKEPVQGRRRKGVGTPGA